MFSVDALTGLVEFRPRLAPCRRPSHVLSGFTASGRPGMSWCVPAIPALPEADALFDGIFSL